jgi:hypothetical protein
MPLVPEEIYWKGQKMMRKFNKRWLVILCVLIMVLSTAGIASAATGQQNNQTPAPASQNDLYNQMLQACLQMGGQMASYCPMLNGSNLTPEQMIKVCLQMQSQMMNMSPQNIAAMQQACLQWYQQSQNANWNAQGAYGKAQSASWNNMANRNYTNNWGYKNASGKWSGMGGYCW